MDGTEKAAQEGIQYLVSFSLMYLVTLYLLRIQILDGVYVPKRNRLISAYSYRSLKLLMMLLTTR
jgi:hypothetical protein